MAGFGLVGGLHNLGDRERVGVAMVSFADVPAGIGVGGQFGACGTPAAGVRTDGRRVDRDGAVGHAREQVLDLADGGVEHELGEHRQPLLPCGQGIGVGCVDQVFGFGTGQMLVRRERRGVHRFNHGFEQASYDRIARFEALVMVGVVRDAEALPQRFADAEVEDVGEPLKDDASVVHLAAEVGADEEGAQSQSAAAAAIQVNELLKEGDEPAVGHFVDGRFDVRLPEGLPLSTHGKQPLMPVVGQRAEAAHPSPLR
jgi:hypothetical protein